VLFDLINSRSSAGSPLRGHSLQGIVEQHVRCLTCGYVWFVSTPTAVTDSCVGCMLVMARSKAYCPSHVFVSYKFPGI